MRLNSIAYSSSLIKLDLPSQAGIPHTIVRAGAIRDAAGGREALAFSQSGASGGAIPEAALHVSPRCQEQPLSFQRCKCFNPGGGLCISASTTCGACCAP